MRVAISMRERESRDGEKDVMPRPEIIETDGKCYCHHRHGSPSLFCVAWSVSIEFAEAAGPRHARSKATKITLHPRSRIGDKIMSTKFNVAALGAVLAVLAVPGVVSAQEGFGNYPSAQGLRDASAAPTNRSQPQMNRFATKMPYDAYGSVAGSAAIPGTMMSPRGRAFETDRDNRDRRGN
jgi:hypothetical protein